MFQIRVIHHLDVALSVVSERDEGPVQDRIMAEERSAERLPVAGSRPEFFTGEGPGKGALHGTVDGTWERGVHPDNGGQLFQLDVECFGMVVSIEHPGF